MISHSRITIFTLAICILAGFYLSARPASSEESAPVISSRVELLPGGGRIVVQEVLIEASVADVWAAYTTSEGWMAWASPVAKVDLRPGGRIQTHYQPDAKIGDPGTNTLHISSYVPQRILTLRAELSDNWPEVMKQDSENLANVILFESLTPTRTKIESYGVGYGASPEYDQLMEFFIPANEGLFQKLIEYLEP